MLNEEALGVIKPFARQFLLYFDSESEPDSLSIHRHPYLLILTFLSDFFHSVLKDIRMGRSKIRDTDNLRVLFLCRFFMEYFLALRQQEKDERAQRQRQQQQQQKMTQRQAEKSRDPFGNADFDDDDTLMAELDRAPVPQNTDEANAGALETNELLDFRYLAEVFQDETRGWLGKRLGEAKDTKVGVYAQRLQYCRRR
jgi:hypothetical protein